jgi:hypothetical protein
VWCCEYLGAVAGKIHFMDTQHEDHWVEGPRGIALESSRGRLWSLFSRSPSRKGNVAIAWQPLTEQPDCRQTIRYEFLAFVIKPVKALEELVLHQDCLVGY